MLDSTDRDLKPTPPTMKRALARIGQAFPAVTFTVEPGGRSGSRVITWTGGPAADQVAAVAPSYERPQKTGFHRRDTPEELAAMMERWDREAAERAAAEPARRAKAKADGIAKRRATLDGRKALAATLTRAYPETVFTIGHHRSNVLVEWTGGPSREHVASLIGYSEWCCTRTDSAADIAARLAREAEAERLECEATDAAIAQAKAVAAERERARQWRLDSVRRQMALPMRCPGVCIASFGPLPLQLIEDAQLAAMEAQ